MKSRDISKTFCIMPWKAVNLNASGYFTPCCSSEYVIADSEKMTAEDVWHSEKYVEIRSAMLRGQWHPACEECQFRERDAVLKDSEYLSARHNFNRDHIFEKEWEGLQLHSKPPLNLVELELDFSNVCNLKCNMCGSYNSTSWVDDEKALGKEVSRRFRKRQAVSEEQYSSYLEMAKKVKYLRFKGGEPFLIKEPMRILTDLASQGFTDKTVHFVTNGTLFRREQLEVLNAFRHIDFEVSVDACGQPYQYMRGGKKYPFEVVEQNLMMATETLNEKGAQITLNTTYQNLNAFNLYDFTVWFDQFSKNCRQKHSLIRSILTGPEIYQSHNLPQDLKQEVVEQIQRTMSWMKSHPQNDLFCTSQRVNTVLGDCLRFVDTSFDESLWQEFLEHTAKLDKIRQMSIVDYNPQFEAYF